MQTSSTSGIELQHESASGPKGVAAPVQAGQLIIYILLLMPGLMVSLHSFSAYPLLDARPAMGLMLCLYLLPWSVFLLSMVLKRAANAGGLLGAYSLFRALRWSSSEPRL
jgi:hypothetical protein